MAKGTTLGKVLRAWRLHKGLKLEEAAALIAEEAEKAGIEKKERNVPRTHASLIRWEKGQVEPKITGLQIIAAAYKTTAAKLQDMPPVAGDNTEAQVDEFRRFLKRNPG